MDTWLSKTDEVTQIMGIGKGHGVFAIEMRAIEFAQEDQRNQTGRTGNVSEVALIEMDRVAPVVELPDRE